MLSDLQQRKLTKMFRMLDSDNDGVLQPDDYQGMSSRLLGVLAPPPGSPQAAEIVESYVTEWRELAELAAKRGENQVSLGVFLAYRDEQLSGPDAFAIMIDPYVEVVFTLLDADEDGLLSSDDVCRYLGVYGMRDAEKREILGKIDPQQRGCFTRKQIGELARQYYFSQDESAPGSWLLGRPADNDDRRSAQDIAHWLVAEIARLLEMPQEEVALDEPITSYLVDSRDALTLAADLQDWLSVEISADVVWDHPTVAALSAYAAAVVNNLSRAQR